MPNGKMTYETWADRMDAVRMDARIDNRPVERCPICNMALRTAFGLFPPHGECSGALTPVK